MKLWKRAVAFALAVSLCLGLFGCRRNNSTDASTVAPESTGTAQNATHTVQILTGGGMPFEGVGVYIYEDSTLAELVWFAKTDADGRMTFDAPQGGSYVAVLKDIPQGYPVADSYPLTGTESTIVLEAEMASDIDLANTVFNLGDVMYNMEVTDVNGKTYRIAELLEQKQAVVLNFWYLGCTPCKMEFPYLQEAYEELGDKVAVLALNPIDSDEAAIKAYAKELGLTFPVAVCDKDMQKAMKLTAYPTTMVIDRFGIISMIHQGALTSAQNFEDIFNHFAAEDYEQGVVEKLEDILTTPEEEEITNPTEVGGVTSFTLTVRAGEVVYCDVYRMSGMNMRVHGEEAYTLYVGDAVHESGGGYLNTMIFTPDVRTPAVVGIRNKGTETHTYTFNFSALKGSLNNPYKLELGEFDVDIPAGYQEGVYYTYKAPKDGYLVIQCVDASRENYGFQLYNLNSYAVRTLEADSEYDDDGNIIVKIQAKKGQTIQFNPSALPDDQGNYPAIKLTFKASMTDGLEEDESAKKIVYGVTVTDENRQPISGVKINMEKIADLPAEDTEDTENPDAGEPEQDDTTVNNDKIDTGTTNDKGVAAWKLMPAIYKAVITLKPGYSGKTTELVLTNTVPTVSVMLVKDADVVFADYTVRIVDEDGNPVGNVSVTVEGSTVVTDANGLAVFNLPEGSYTAIVAVPDGYTSDSFTYGFDESKNAAVVLKKSTGGEDPGEQGIDYTVNVTDYYGNAMNGVTVTFYKDGVPVSVKQIEGGSAVAKLAEGEYTVSLGFASPHYYDESNTALSAEETSITIQAIPKRGNDYMDVCGNATYPVGIGATYVYGMQSNTYNYFIFDPAEEGVYSFSASAPISYWGAVTAYIAEQTAGTDYNAATNTFTREVRTGQADSDAIVFIFALNNNKGEGATEAIIEIKRIGDVHYTDEELAEWIIFEGTETPAEGTKYKPAHSGELTFVDITGATAATTPVKGSDGYYHLGSETGPVLYVNLGPNGRYMNFYQMMGFEQAGGTFFNCVFYDADGNFVKKEQYAPCLQQYTAAVDAQGDGVYKLTDDLIYMLQNGGRHAGWWNPESMNYLFVDSNGNPIAGINNEIAWMFNCCYYD